MTLVGDLRHDGAQVSTASNGTTNWYWRKPVAAVEPVPLADHVERMEERRERLGAVVLLRRLAVPQLVERVER